MRRLLLLPLVLAGCGGTAHVDRAAPQTIRVRWDESDAGLAYSVRSIAVTADGWRVRASVANRRATPLEVVSLHRRGKTRFGILVSTGRDLPRTSRLRDLRTPFFAESASPAVPTTLLPGRSWSGTFSGPGRPPRRAFVRVLFGRFVPPETGEGFALVTRHVVRLGG
jgi:hypothetical protein